jgi:hypothetical protein
MHSSINELDVLEDLNQAGYRAQLFSPTTVNWIDGAWLSLLTTEW